MPAPAVDRGSGGRPPRRPVVVHSATRLTPHLVRIVAGGELADWPHGDPGAHFKVFVPQRGAEPAMRTYTVRRFDPGAGRLTIDFALHGSGPAADWAASARPGDRFEVSGRARSGFLAAPDSEWCLIAGDHAALPAIAALVEALAPGFGPVPVLVEIPEPSERLTLCSAASLEVTWLHRRAGEAPCERLVAAALATALPSGAGEVWVGCEAEAMRRIRRHFLGSERLEPRSLHTRAYWRVGVADHPDHDTGAEDD